MTDFSSDGEKTARQTENNIFLQKNLIWFKI